MTPNLPPTNWPVIAREIRIDRAENRCECDGRCGRENVPHQSATYGDFVTLTFAEAAIRTPHRCTNTEGLTVVPLDHDPGNIDRINLLTMCVLCRIAYTADHHAETRAATLAARRGAQSAEIPLPGLGLEL